MHVHKNRNTNKHTHTQTPSSHPSVGNTEAHPHIQRIFTREQDVREASA